MKFFLLTPFFAKQYSKLYYYGKVRGAVSRACLNFFPFCLIYARIFFFGLSQILHNKNVFFRELDEYRYIFLFLFVETFLHE